MKKLLLKSITYFVFLLLVLEVLVRVFHLAKDNPKRILDQKNVEKWAPNQQGYSVTGNRRQNFSKFTINASGFNSYREFTPSQNTFEVAIVGDSFIEGFHQNVQHSIGHKIEEQLPNIHVYEYGYAGYDFADQMHLIYQYKDQFKFIDKVIIGINFNDDLLRSSYTPTRERLALEEGYIKWIKKSKLIVYTQSIGLFAPVKRFIRNLLSFSFSKNTSIAPKTNTNEHLINEKNSNNYIKNFQSLTSLYKYDKMRFTLLLDSKTTPQVFLDYLNSNQFSFIDIQPKFETSTKNKTLIYDQHWNDLGRSLVAASIVDYLKAN